MRFNIAGLVIEFPNIAEENLLFGAVFDSKSIQLLNVSEKDLAYLHMQKLAGKVNEVAIYTGNLFTCYLQTRYYKAVVYDFTRDIFGSECSFTSFPVEDEGDYVISCVLQMEGKFFKLELSLSFAGSDLTVGSGKSDFDVSLIYSIRGDNLSCSEIKRFKYCCSDKGMQGRDDFTRLLALDMLEGEDIDDLLKGKFKCKIYG